MGLNHEICTTTNYIMKRQETYRACLKKYIKEIRLKLLENTKQFKKFDSNRLTVEIHLHQKYWLCFVIHCEYCK